MNVCLRRKLTDSNGKEETPTKLRRVIEHWTRNLNIAHLIFLPTQSVTHPNMFTVSMFAKIEKVKLQVLLKMRSHSIHSQD